MAEADVQTGERFEVARIDQAAGVEVLKPVLSARAWTELLGIPSNEITHRA